MKQAPIRIGIAGYGNLGRGVKDALALLPDMQLAGVFTRRQPSSLQDGLGDTPVWPLSEASGHQDMIDVMILCGGSKQDLPEQGPELARWFNTVDSFDTHAAIPQYFDAVNQVASKAGKVAIISTGWDPGLFSLNRMLGEAILPAGDTYTFWGKGLSQGHSDAVRRVSGVQDGVQYTLPREQAMERVRAGERPRLDTRDKHARVCYVVLEPDADADRVRHDIITMPDYFADYDTTVHFVDQETLERDHAGMPHGGFVIRSAQTGGTDTQTMEFSLRLGNNPGFTSSVLLAYARAAWRMKQAGQSGAYTVFDVPPGLLSPRSAAELRKDLL